MTTNFLTFLKSKLNKPEAVSLNNNPITSFDEIPAVPLSAEPKRIYNIGLIVKTGKNKTSRFKYSCDGLFRASYFIACWPGEEQKVEKDFASYDEAFEEFKRFDQFFVDNFYRRGFAHFKLATFFIQEIIINDPNDGFKDKYSVLLKSCFKPQTLDDKINKAPELI
jgi:hypothetical protein